MKINKGFELREMCGEHIIIGTGVENIDFSKVISLNESAAWLWREVEGKEFTPESLAALLMGQYDVDEATALADATALVSQWVSVGIVTE
ncbi:MAG: PqqD family protein [Bacteroidaceae bacterium]|nr:PqqD family protein [Bacteroidaceae bacterium]